MIQIEESVEHRHGEGFLLLRPCEVRKPDGAVVGQLDKGVVCWRKVTGTNMAPSDAVHGVYDASPCPSGVKQVIKIYRDIEGGGRQGVDVGEVGTEFGPLSPSTLVFLLSVEGSSGVDELWNAVDKMLKFLTGGRYRNRCVRA